MDEPTHTTAGSGVGLLANVARRDRCVACDLAFERPDLLDHHLRFVPVVSTANEREAK